MDNLVIEEFTTITAVLSREIIGVGFFFGFLCGICLFYSVYCIYEKIINKKKLNDIKEV